MGDYHLFPQARRSGAVKYSASSQHQTICKASSQGCFTEQHQDSCESLLMVDVPSPELCNSDEINQIWHRVSQHSVNVHSLTAPSTNTGSVYRSARSSSDYKYQNLLPPPIEYSNSHIPSDSVICRLSSASTEALSDSSPVLTKRSVTPDLLMQLSYDLGDIGHRHDTKAPSMPYLTSTRSSRSSQSTIAVEMDSRSPKLSYPELSIQSQNRATNSPETPPTSPTSPPSCRQNDGEVTGCASSTHAPSSATSVTAHEISHFDWDDDDNRNGRLARMKKSIGDLRAAALRTKPELPPVAPKLNTRRPSQQTQPPSPRSPRSKNIKHDLVFEHPPRPLASRSNTYPTPIFSHPAYPPALPPPQGPLPPRPVTRPAASAERIQQCLPPLPSIPPEHIHRPAPPHRITLHPQQPSTHSPTIPTSNIYQPSKTPASPPTTTSTASLPTTPSSVASTLVSTSTSPHPSRRRSSSTKTTTTIIPNDASPPITIPPRKPRRQHSVRSVRRSRRVSTASAFSCMSASSAPGGKKGKTTAAATAANKGPKGMVGLRQLMRWALVVAGCEKGSKGGERRVIGNPSVMDAGCVGEKSEVGVVGV